MAETINHPVVTVTVDTSDDEITFEDAVEELRDVAANYLDHDYLHVTARGLGWNRTGGTTVIRHRDLFDHVTLDAEYRLVATITAEEPDTLRVERWSHDEPVGGAVFTFRPATEAAAQAAGL